MATAFPGAVRRIRPRRSGSALVLVVGACLLVGIIVGAFYYLKRNAGESDVLAPLTTAVHRGVYDRIILSNGELESANNVEIRCEIRSATRGTTSSTTIIDIIPEGTVVKEGDWLVTFDDSALQDEKDRQKVKVYQSESACIQARAGLESARTSLDEYMKGTYEQESKTHQNSIFLAEQKLKQAELTFDSVRRSVAKGILSTLQEEGERFKVDAARKELELAQNKLTILETLTMKKMKVQLESDIEVSEVKVRTEEDSYKTEQDKLAQIEGQIAKCRIVAPANGQVTYANVTSMRQGSEFVVEAGASVRENQIIIRLPDANAMQVKTTVPESKINYVREGMPASVRIEAFGDDVLEGRIEKVNKYPEPQSWMNMGAAKEYKFLVKVLNPPAHMRVGLTAEVRVHSEHREDTLQIPVQSVYEHERQTFCLVKAKGGDTYETRHVKIDSTNGKVAAITEKESELSEGDEIVLDPRAHKDKFDEKKLTAIAARELEIAAKAPKQDTSLQPVANATPTGQGGPGAGGPGAGGPGAGSRGGGPAETPAASGGGAPPAPAGSVAGGPPGGAGAGPPGGASGGPPGGGARGGRGGFQLPANGAAYMKLNDKNKDGKVTEDELDERGRMFFSNIDTNGDGGVDEKEADAMLKRVREMMNSRGGFGGGGGPPGGGQ